MEGGPSDAGCTDENQIGNPESLGGYISMLAQLDLRSREITDEFPLSDTEAVSGF